MTGKNRHTDVADGSVPSELWTVEPGTIDPGAAQPLWDRLIRAKTESPIVSVAEDAVFRFYLPLAEHLPAVRPSLSATRIGPNRRPSWASPELWLAWRQHDCRAFVTFARGVILHQLQANPAGATPRRRLTAVTARHP